jgi:hypothetical protein
VTEYEVTPPPTRLAHSVQVRLGFSRDRGTVTKFLVQLEYWLDGDWRTVVRYDHDEDSQGGHDVTEEGLHLDIYRDGEKVRVEEISGPLPANEAFEYAEDDLKDNAEQYVRRFEKWHGVKDGSDL